jgi:hypothetical protein
MNTLHKPLQAKAIWLLSNTELTARAISKLIGLDHSQVGRINSGDLIERAPVFEGLQYPIRRRQGKHTVMNEDQMVGYVQFLLYELDEIEANWREQQFLYVGVYQIICRKTNKSYVGATANIRNRFAQHRNAQQNPEMAADMKHYGLDNFEFKVLERIPDDKATHSYLKEREGYYIRLIQPEYNVVGGSRPFLQLDKDLRVINRFITFSEAVGVAPSTSNLQKALQGRIVSLYGFYWVYEDEYTPDWQPRLDKRLKPFKVIDTLTNDKMEVFGTKAVLDVVECNKETLRKHVSYNIPKLINRQFKVERIEV